MSPGSSNYRQPDGIADEINKVCLPDQVITDKINNIHVSQTKNCLLHQVITGNQTGLLPNQYGMQGWILMLLDPRFTNGMGPLDSLQRLIFFRNIISLKHTSNYWQPEGVSNEINKVYLSDQVTSGN